ncbi:dermonecrotic toxin domain-containing protein [Pseudomonas lundensis]|uniref:dermonecrotic toxin domain-containing protein n=1 Tax=Pseudomonas lundensis TaxID=86185 RepID=UPI00089DC76C|nr:DUF6543 domain-containing protein [Pseudomonas lundensis]
MNLIAHAALTEQALHALYLRGLDAAQTAGVIGAVEHDWLSQALTAVPDETGNAIPAHVSSVFLSRHQSRTAQWAGALLLTHTAATQSPVFLLTPLGALEKFNDLEALSAALELRLDDPLQREPVLRFCPVDVRPLLSLTGELTLRTRDVPTPVLTYLSQTLNDFLTASQADTLERLLATPTLRALVDQQLQIQLELHFAGQPVTAQNIHRASTPQGQTPDEPGPSLSSVALELFVNGQLAPDRSYTWTGPFTRSSAENDADLDRRFTRVLTAVTEQLMTRLSEAMSVFWDLPAGTQPSPHAYCVARLGDVYFQHLVQAHQAGELSSQTFQALQQLLAPQHDPARIGAARLLVSQGNGAEVELAGLLCLYLPGQNNGVYVFSASTGLVSISTRARLSSYVLSKLRSPATFDTIARHAPQDQHPLLAGMVSPTLRVENIAGAVFEDCIHAVRAKQIRDFVYLTGQYQDRRLALAAVDHALDVRALIDPGLLALNSRGRWDSRFLPDSNGLPLAVNENGLSDVLSLKLPKTLAQRDALLRQWPTPRMCARHLWVAVLNQEGQRFIDVSEVWVQVFDADESSVGRVPQRTLTLIDALLERVTGRYPLPQNPAFLQGGIRSSVDEEIKPLKRVSGTKLLTLLDMLAKTFDQAFRQQLSTFFYTPYTSLAPDTLARHLATLRHVMLRADLRLMVRGNHLETQDKHVISTVLTYPVSAQRPALNQFVPDVFSVFLNLGAPFSGVSLTHCLLITERGGQASESAGRAILWTPVSGFEGFASVDQCKAHLEALLLDQSLRSDLLDQVRRDEQSLIGEHLDSRSDWAVEGENQWVNFERFEEDFVYQSQEAAINTVLLDADYVCRQARDTPLTALSFENLARSLLNEGLAGLNLERHREMAETQQLELALPLWLKNASRAEQLAYANLLQRYPLAVQEKGNYLQGIPDIEDYARTELKAQLALDFPDRALDPDAIEVVLDTYVAAPVAVGSTPSFLAAATSRDIQPLTRFALNGFNRLEGGSMFLRPVNGSALPLALDARYATRLARRLDIGRHYQALLKSTLAPESEGAAQRQRQFGDQLLLQVLEQGLREKLSGSLSATAYAYLKHVIERPDGIARDPLNGVSLIIRPLELIADPGRDPDLATGLYIVGPPSGEVGPQLLWVMYSEHFSLKEYASEGQLLADLYTRESLQNVMLQRLPAFERKTYANGGFVEPHLPHYSDSQLLNGWQTPPPVALANRPILGNLFSTLYRDNYRLLLEMAGLQSKTTAQADWESFTYLMTLVVNTAVMFVPGKLSIPIVVWQALGLFREGVSASKQARWVEAVANFALSLVVLATTRRAWHSLIRPVGTGVIDEVGAETFARADLQFQGPAPGLMPYRANDVALVDLTRDPQTQIYSNPQTGLYYVPLSAQVFRVQAWRNRWRIYLDETREGPLIKLNAQQHWEVDVAEPLPGGGPAASRMSEFGTLATNALTYEIQAIGMDSIGRRFPDKALNIRQAHELATAYLKRATQALKDLDAPGSTSRKNGEFLKTFFDLESLEPVHLEHVTTRIDALLARFLHPELSPYTSRKYVVCRSRFNSRASAFVNRADSSRRIYLTEVFFNTLFERSYALSHPYLKAASPPFRAGQHLRASFLLHEVTHDVLDTEDIHYLNAGFPYLDLLDVELPFGHYLKMFTEEIQRNHSPQASTDHLFKAVNRETLQWEDIPRGPAKTRIKQIAGVSTLDQARLVFRNDAVKRVELMLANADTLVLLIVQLGRVYPVLA